MRLSYKDAISWNKEKKKTSYVKTVIHWSLIFFSTFLMLLSVFQVLGLSIIGGIIFEAGLLVILGLYRVPYSALWLPALSALAVWRLYVHQREAIVDGINAIVNYYCYYLNDYYGWNISWPLGSFEYFVYILIAMAFLLVILIEAIVKLTGLSWLRFIMPFAVLVLEGLVGFMPGFWGLAVLLLALVFYCSRGNIRAVIISVAIIGLAAIFVQKPAESLVLKSAQINEFQFNLETKLKNGFSGFFINRSEKVDNTKPEYSDKKLLEIEAAKRPEGNLYLIESRKSDYENGVWSEGGNFREELEAAGYDYETCTKSLLDRYCQYEQSAIDLCYGYQDQDAYSESIKVGGDFNFYCINYVGLTNGAALLPYTTDLYNVPEIELEGDAVCRKSALTSSIEFSALSRDKLEDTYIDYAENNSADFMKWYDNYVYDHYLQVPDGMRELLLEKEQMLRTGVFTEGYGDSSSDTEYYFSVTEDEINDYVDSLSRMQYADSIASNISYMGTYSWDLKSLPEGKDPTEFFMEDWEGYCKHFASAATLIFRAKGIPARYVTGYVVKGNEFSKGRDALFRANVLDRNAHAWTEVYIDGFGWYPVEPTPGYASYYEELPTSKDKAKEREQLRRELNKRRQEEKANQDTQQPSEKDSQTKSEKKPEQSSQKDSQKDTQTKSSETAGGGVGLGKGNGTGTDLGRILLIVAGIGGALGLLALIIFQIKNWKKRRISRYERLLKKGRGRTLAKQINRGIYRRLLIKRGQISFKQVRDREYEELLIRHFPMVTESDWERYMDVVKRVAYSYEDISEEECRHLLFVYKCLSNS